jgi:hypothetical protein
MLSYTELWKVGNRYIQCWGCCVTIGLFEELAGALSQPVETSLWRLLCQPQSFAKWAQWVALPS